MIMEHTETSPEKQDMQKGISTLFKKARKKQQQNLARDSSKKSFTSFTPTKTSARKPSRSPSNNYMKHTISSSIH